MRMRFLAAVAVGVAFTAGSVGYVALAPFDAEGDHDHEHDAKANAHDNGHDEGEVLSYTHYTDRTEVFLEHPPLIAGEPASFVVHMTRLPDFKAVGEGEITVRLEGGGSTETFSAGPSTTAGIFRTRVQPTQPGKRLLTVVLKAPGLKAVHDLGEIEVFVDQEAAHAAAPAEDDEDGDAKISFPKEVQWRTDFATEVVGVRRIRDSIPATATLRAPASDEALISAPGAGILLPSTEFPRVGMEVKKGQVVAFLASRLGGETDSATLELAMRKARLAYDLAVKERQRLEGLLKLKAISERRVIEARNQEAVAKAELDAAAQRRLPYQGTTGGIALRSPISGVIAAVTAAPGAAVTDGQQLFHVANPERLWLEVRVPEALAGRVQAPSGAWFKVDGIDRTFTIGDGAGSFVSSSNVIDPESRTIAVLFEFPNPDAGLKVGMFAQAHVFTGVSRETPAIPASAVVYDAGTFVVFVQVGGESFVRRIVRLGAREGDFYAVESGLEHGERVVTRGAYRVKLAATSGAVPHGHAH